MLKDKPAKKCYLGTACPAGNRRTAEIGQRQQFIKSRQRCRPFVSNKIYPCFGKKSDGPGNFSLKHFLHFRGPFLCLDLFAFVAQNVDYIKIRPVDTLFGGIFVYVLVIAFYCLSELTDP